MCEINASTIKDQNDLNQRAAAAAFLGTLQAGFTDFHYLRDVWKKTTEKDALIGVGQTGIASGAVLDLNLEEAAQIVKERNEVTAKAIGINPAARTTLVKPSGTTSCVLGTSSGIHGWHNDYYVRRQQVNKNESLYYYMYLNHPELVEESLLDSNIAFITLPQKAPEGSIYRTESALALLERVKKFNLEWVRPGHRSGDNYNNVSATISVKEHEWEEVGRWMWINRHTFNGLSVLPYDGGTYTQTPFENISQEEFEYRAQFVDGIDLTKVVELEDGTNLSGELACAGDACEVIIISGE